MPQCTAKAKSTGKRCRRYAVTGYTVCQVHGAGSPKQGRPGGRPIVHGRYSKRLPQKLVARYDEARVDPELLSLRDDVALLDVRISDLTDKLSTGETDNLLQSLLELCQGAVLALKGGDFDMTMKMLEEMRQRLEGQPQDGWTWTEIVGLLDQRRKLVESERKRLVELQQYVTVEQVMILVSALTKAVISHVNEHSVIAAIQAEFGVLIRDSCSQLDAGSGGACEGEIVQ